MKARFGALAAAIAAALLTAQVSAADPPVAVTTCGQAVSGEAGYLTGDLDCTGFAGDAVTVVNGSLDLKGFTLTGGDNDGVRCEGRCEILSVPANGTITGAKHNGVTVGGPTPASNAVITDVMVTANGSPDTWQIGVNSPDAGILVLGFAELVNVTVSNVVGWGVDGNEVVMRNSHLIDNSGSGFVGLNITAINSTISGNGGTGIYADRVTITGSTVEDNGPTDPFQNGSLGPDGIIVFRSLKMSNSTVRLNYHNGVEIWASKALIDSSQITDNAISGGYAGIHGVQGKLRLTGSTVSGNDFGIDVSEFSVKVDDSSISSNDTGIRFLGGKTSVSGSQILSNTTYGVRALNTGIVPMGKLLARFRGQETKILGNGTYDISSQVRPRFVYEAGVNECDRSELNAPGTRPHWGICALDCTNGALNPGETCDDGGESVACDDDCTVPACGDANFNEAAGEECDDGGVSADDGCDTVCKVEFCGDSITQPGIGEACDSGGVDSATCDYNCTAVVCGDFHKNTKAGEQCDDANMLNGDGCSSTCQKE